jgi:hypothetical protein
LIPNRTSPPGNGVLAGRIVADTVRVDTQSATGSDGTDEVVALRDYHQL